MPKKRVDMSKIKDVLRLKFDSKLSNRDVAHCLKIGAATVSDILARFRTAKLQWPLPDDLTETQLEARLYPNKRAPSIKAQPDFMEAHQELKRKGMTKLLLWQESLERNPDNAYGYTQYCELYKRWSKKLKRSMRQLHMAGEKLFIDFCGLTVPIVNPDTGEVRKAQVFVATMGASNFTYVEACESQKQESWLKAHVNAFEFFGGIVQLLIPDNLKSATTKADRYEPVLNESYLKLARHYNTVIIPARPYKPKDKAKAENAVLIVERWLLMRIRKMTFYTLASLNQVLRELLHDLNTRPLRMQPDESRQSLFNKLDKPALKPMPAHPYEYVDFHQAKVAIDYHVLYKKHAYSVPNIYVGERVQLEAGERLVRIFFKGECIAQHPRSHRQGGFTTITEHMPLAHQKQRWSPERLMSWGASIGPGTRALVEHLLNSKPHPEQAYKTCLGLLSHERKYTAIRLENACQKALLLNRPNRATVDNLLKNNLEDQPVSEELPTAPLQHDNIRGANFYN